VYASGRHRRWDRRAAAGIDAGDLAIVRPDGLRIVVEVRRSPLSRRTVRRCDAWIG
jgi:hypothetical protein